MSNLSKQVILATKPKRAAPKAKVSDQFTTSYSFYSTRLKKGSPHLLN